MVPLGQQGADLLAESARWADAFSELGQVFRTSPRATVNPITEIHGLDNINNFIAAAVNDTRDEMLTAQPQRPPPGQHAGRRRGPRRQAAQPRRPDAHALPALRPAQPGHPRVRRRHHRPRAPRSARSTSSSGGSSSATARWPSCRPRTTTTSPSRSTRSRLIAYLVDIFERVLGAGAAVQRQRQPGRAAHRRGRPGDDRSGCSSRATATPPAPSGSGSAPAPTPATSRRSRTSTASRPASSSATPWAATGASARRRPPRPRAATSATTTSARRGALSRLSRPASTTGAPRGPSGSGHAARAVTLTITALAWWLRRAGGMALGANCRGG